MQNSKPVYSTEKGRICPGCCLPVDDCICAAQKNRTAGDGIMQVRLENKGRKGKTVTIISGASMGAMELRDLAARLRQKLATGGSVKKGMIIIQGNHKSRIIDLLEEKGHRVRH